MFRLKKYFKPFIISVLLILVLLYSRAQFELALPDYLSKIVSNGIQGGGVESSVPDLISKESMEQALLFMDEASQEEVLSHYELKDSDTSFDYVINPDLETTIPGVYELQEVSQKEFDSLESKFTQPLVIASSIEAAMSGEGEIDSPELEEMLASIPAGMTFFDVYPHMPESQKEEFVSKMNESFSALGESTLVIVAADAVKQEYAAMGIDTQQIQNNYIYNAGTMMLLISLAGVICAIAAGYFASKVAANIARKMRSDLFKKIESFSVYEFNQFSTASLITRTTNDIQQIQMSLMMILKIVLYAPILGFGAVLLVLDADVTMLYIIVGTVLAMMVFIIIIMILGMPKFKVMQKLTDKLNLVGRESLGGMLVVRAFGREHYEEEKFEKANQDILKTGLFVGRLMSLLMPVIMLVMNVSSLLIVWVGGHQVDAGSLQIGEMMAFIQYAMQIIMAFMMIAMVTIFVSRGSVSAKRFWEVMDTPLTIHDPKQPISFTNEEKGHITFKNVNFAYPNAEENTLCDISFESFAGQTTAIIGGTGCGKSTLINLIPRFFDCTSGSIEINGVDITKVTQQELRSKIGLVPQKGVLFSGTIESNIKYSDEQMNDEQMKLAAQVAQATDFIEEKKEHYNESIAQGGSNVSGGQKQRLSIARAIAKNPEIFIFDDSFSALDFKTDAKLREALNTLCKKTNSSILLVGQRVASIMHADQIIVLEEGKIAGKGTHEQLMKSCVVYQEIAYSQLSKEELGHE